MLRAGRAGKHGVAGSAQNSARRFSPGHEIRRALDADAIAGLARDSELNLPVTETHITNTRRKRELSDGRNIEAPAAKLSTGAQVIVSDKQRPGAIRIDSI